MGLTFSAHEQWPKYEDMVWILIKILKSSPLIKWFKDYPGNLYATIKTSGGEVILQKTQNYWRMEFPTAYVQRSKYNKLIYELVRRSNKELKIHFDILLDLMSENFDLNRIIQREAPQRPMPRPPPSRQRPPTPPRPRPPSTTASRIYTLICVLRQAACNTHVDIVKQSTRNHTRRKYPPIRSIVS